MTNRRHPIKQLSKPPASKRTLATFKATHDPSTVIPNKIRTALDRMKRDQGPEAYAYEMQDPEATPFTKLADVSTNYLSQFRVQFMGHLVKASSDIGAKRAPRWVWFATAAAATKARGRPAKAEDFA